MPKPFRRPPAGAREASLFTPPASAQPLAARMRPRTLDEVVGQQKILGPGKPLRDAIEKGAIGSMVFWGPPGSGKTTIGRLIARYTDREFVPFSAVTEGVPRIREIIAAAVAPIRAKAQEYMNDRSYLDSVLKVGAEKARTRARVTLNRVYEQIGFLPRL